MAKPFSFFCTLKKLFKPRDVLPLTKNSLAQRADDPGLSGAMIVNQQAAKALFCGPEKYNCAQAVLAAYQDCCAIQDSEIVAAGTKGFGKARDGICGALYAGDLLLKDPAKAEQLHRNFEALAGSVKCKKILKLKRITCEECVTHTARLLAEQLVPGCGSTKAD